MSLQQRKARVAQKKAYFLKQQGEGEDDDDDDDGSDDEWAVNPINYLQSTLVCSSYDLVANSGFLVLPTLSPFCFFAQPRYAHLLAWSPPW